MNIRNFEFKARVDNLDHYENKLLLLNPLYQGTDQQADTYFKVSKGRLKLREGNIENSLINYYRQDTAGVKESDIMLYRHHPDKALKDILSLQFGIKLVVNKKRKIYFKENVKFHFDEVEHLGSYLEVEAIDSRQEFTGEELKKQCNKYYRFFGLNKSQLIDKSYCDLLEAALT